MDERELNQRLRRLERELDAALRELAHVPLRPAVGGGGGLAIQEVDEFPAIPSSPRLIHYTGDNQLWYANDGYDAWTPLEGFTEATGEPPA